jgi:hypothetical protein
MVDSLIGKQAYAKCSDNPVTIVSEPIPSPTGVKVVIVFSDLTMDTIDVSALILAKPF